MKLAFWKRKRNRRTAPVAPGAALEPDFDAPAADADDERTAALAVRVRTRRRLIGACALLLAAVILVPMVLDPTPRVVPDTIPIDLPSDRTPFTPHPPAPSIEAPAPATDAAAPPAAPGSAADAAAVAGDATAAAPAADPHTARQKPAAEAPASDAHKDKAGHKPEGAALGGKIYVQAGAMAHQSAAQELSSRLNKSGLASYVERSQTGEGVRYRVRLGPFASRSEAERSRARLRALGVEANIVGA